MIETGQRAERPPTAGLLQRISSFVASTVQRMSLRQGGNDGAQCSQFTSAFIALGAKMAKADGVAIDAEAEAFEKFLEVEGSEVVNVRRLYAQAATDTTGYQAYADRIAILLEDDAETKRRVFDCLFYVACSDGILHPAEDKFLRDVAARFGYSDHDFQTIRASFVHDPESPYAVLDLSPDASNKELKTRYRRLVGEYHPDRLIASGAPAAVVKAATVKIAAINTAYEQIAKDRGLR